MNTRHPNLKFTVEKQRDSIPFLDVQVSVNENDITTEVYRKPTFTGVLLNYQAYCPSRWKHTLITGILHRTYNISSNWTIFNKEIKNVVNLLRKNGYPRKVIDTCIQRFLNKKYNVNANVNDNVNDNRSDGPTRYVVIPYINGQSVKLRNRLHKVYKELNIDIRIVYKSFKVHNYFSLKDKTPHLMQSSVVYNYECQVDPESRYVGKTTRRLHQRVEEHVKNNSAISVHLKDCRHCSNHVYNNFSIIYKGQSDIDISIAEALIITEENPKLNKMLSTNGKSFYLKILD